MFLFEMIHGVATMLVTPAAAAAAPRPEAYKRKKRQTTTLIGPQMF